MTAQRRNLCAQVPPGKDIPRGESLLGGEFIGTEQNAGVYSVGRKFTVSRVRHAVLRATALGIYFAELNGVRVGDAYLAPGWTDYRQMLQVQEYDVTALLREGENELVFTVNGGWFCGPLTWAKRRNCYGERSAVCADLRADGKTVLVTDGMWSAFESPIRESSLLDGECVDYTAACKPLTVAVVAFDKFVLVPQMCEPVRTVERLPVKRMLRTPKGELVYDFGQNIAGVAEISTPESFCGTIRLQFAEILVNGNFYTKNLRTAKATDTFSAAGAHTFAPEFTYHGFRYMKMEGAELPPERVTALVRHTDMRRTGRIGTGNARFDRLLQNVVWSQRDNFVDIPTDCPQRDERLGWTGDINAFCRTAAYNYDIRAFMKKWLASLRCGQAKTGELPNIAPDILQQMSAAAMWCDAITMIPWTLYEMYGDVCFLSDNYAAMKKLMAARRKNTENGMIARGFEYGDWLAPDNEKYVGNGAFGRTDAYFLANALQAESLRIVAETAGMLGREKERRRYGAWRDSLLKRMRREYFTATGRLASDTVTAQAVVLHFRIVPEKHRAKLAQALEENVRLHGYRVSTGFIGTPFLLFALADNGQFETARRLLLNSAFPGWLYEADMGATTIWERWDSLLPDGSPNPDGMNSYNHYAYGSFMEFVYRRIAGIEPGAPGFSSLRFAPHPCKGMPRVTAKYHSVRGPIEAGYEQSEGKISFFVQIPEGMRAEICLPGETPFAAESGRYVYERPWEDLACGAFTPESTVSEVCGNPKARQAFTEVFGDLFMNGELAWLQDQTKTLQFMAEQYAEEGKCDPAAFPALLAKANERFEMLVSGERGEAEQFAFPGGVRAENGTEVIENEK